MSFNQCLSDNENRVKYDVAFKSMTLDDGTDEVVPLTQYKELQVAIDFVQSDDLGRVIIASVAKFVRVGNLINMSIYPAENTQTLQANNFLVSDLVIPEEFRPMNGAFCDFTIWIKKASDNLGRDHARLVYDEATAKLFIYDATSNNGLWTNGQDLSLAGISLTYATGFQTTAP